MCVADLKLTIDSLLSLSGLRDFTLHHIKHQLFSTSLNYSWTLIPSTTSTVIYLLYSEARKSRLA